VQEKAYWWQNSFLKVKRNSLLIGGQPAADLAEKHGTPLFVYSRGQIQANYRRLTKILRDNASIEAYIYYAMKANSHPRLLKILRTEGARIDAVSPGEVAAARNAGFPASKILFTGTSLGIDDLQKVLCHRGVIINIDAEEQLELMRETREKWFPHKNFRVSLRINPGIGKGFCSKTVTAGVVAPDGTPIKFGIEKERALQVLQRAIDMGFRPLGLHTHLGSGWTGSDFESVTRAVDAMVTTARKIQDHGLRLEFLDFGGGFGPRYAQEQAIFPVRDYVVFINERIKQAKLTLKSIFFEPGKYLVGDAGVLLMKVEYLKKSHGNLFACVNAGTFNTAPRPAVYTNAYHQIVNCGQVRSDDVQEVTVAGNLCETGDIFARQIPLPVPRRGDILAYLNAGAYCRSMASHYNTRDIPKEILI
jgi:diaminopimelate decarboxylase